MNNPSTVQQRQSHSFSRAPRSHAIQYSTFDRSHSYTTAFDNGYLIPFFVDEVLPGDIFRLDSNHLNRLLTLIAPMYSNLYFKYEFFYVRNRHIFNKWVNLQGEQRNPNDSVDFNVPMLNSGVNGVPVGSIFDYAGIPPLVPNLDFSCLPFRAMNWIYNCYYRDENLCPWLPVGGTTSTDEAGNTVYNDEFGETDSLSNYSLFKRAKKHDYLTSALPWQQKGSPVIINLGGQAKVHGNGKALGITDGTNDSGLINFHHTQSLGDAGTFDDWFLKPKAEAYNTAVGTATDTTPNNIAFNKAIGIVEDGESGLVADLSNVWGISIADWRVAMQIEAVKELDARSGTRYKEALLARFNVNSSDAVLDRPEYLCGNSVAFYTQPVANTTGTTNSPQGDLSAYSLGYSGLQHDFTKGFEEHGWVIGFCSVTGDNLYQYGLDRMFSRSSRFDFFEPLLANISEEPIKNKEVYAQGKSVVDANGDIVDEKTFGYQEAWASYRFKNNMITGKLRSQSKNSSGQSDTLDYLHLGQAYTELPVLNQDFIEVNVPIDRVVAVTDEPEIQSDNYFRLRCTREMPVYSVPAYLGSKL